MVHDVLCVLYFFVPAYLANMSPVLVRGWFPALSTPIDGGRTFRGRRILGDHKTWRGSVRSGSPPGRAGPGRISSTS